MNKKYIIPFILLLTIYLGGCSASLIQTSDRYKKDKNDAAEESQAKNTQESSDSGEAIVADKTPELVIKHPDLKEDFDMTPYKFKPDMDDTIASASTQNDVWVEYEKQEPNAVNTEVSTSVALGYRVQIITSDSLEEANSIKSEVYFKIKLPVYVIYDSPFYKVRAGDFTDISKAKELSFKLNQLGYKSSRVVQDSVNIVK
jgi:hypothetical protein